MHYMRILTRLKLTFLNPGELERPNSNTRARLLSAPTTSPSSFLWAVPYPMRSSTSVCLDNYSSSLSSLGFSLEDVLVQERDAALGNGGLGRLAACYLDSSATQELPVWGYGLRYKYGIFQQLIKSDDGTQLEAPDPWLDHQNPWELPRLDVTYEVRFYGSAQRWGEGTGRATWSGGQEVLAVAYDVMIPGYGTKSTNNLRLWESKPKRGFDLQSFNGMSISVFQYG
jgi:glucan phosphorylase